MIIITFVHIKSAPQTLIARQMNKINIRSKYRFYIPLFAY
ncbi:hypothetical protein XIS1_460129 [Xenorhabdus innexi]|uniref:Uncharacterized protein n=1 Tax=Xenorhabdus innexi TaxID=290109 RepID=A0A1N6MYF4_9GAMM|nr:hypothetical protein XIS1_460129 [Xenorhabdus innexi]